MRLFRRNVDPLLEEALAAHAGGDFDRARELAVELVADGKPSLLALRGLAELEYLQGDYEAAERLLRRVVEESGRDLSARLDAEVALALVFLQTDRYAEAGTLFAGLDAIELPIWELMKSFGDEAPYRLDWGGAGEVTLPLVQTTTWELPCVRIAADGLEVEARIDTGGELVTLSPDVADRLEVESVVTAEGVFAAGARGEIGFGARGRGSAWAAGDSGRPGRRPRSGAARHRNRVRAPVLGNARLPARRARAVRARGDTSCSPGAGSTARRR